MIFRQLLEPTSCSYSYLIGCEETGAAVLIDPVLETIEHDLGVIGALGLRLECTLETHLHADHITGAARARALIGSRIAAPAADGLSCVDIGVVDGLAIDVGALRLLPLFTPGHTDTHHAYVIEAGGPPRLFSGDSLLIDGCGRTDFQNGDARRLFRSIRDTLFALPDDTLVYPGHDYQQRRVSTIGQEKARNPRVGLARSEDEFVALMRGLDLPRPQRIDEAVPANRACGCID